MTKPLFACLIVAAALMTGSAHAYTIIGMGQYSCGTWIKDRRGQQMTAYLYQQWIVGFLSGVGYAGPPGIDPLKGTDSNGVWAWIDNYCQAHPLDNIAEAGSAFVIAHPH
jgi:hypothetical protein